MVGYVDWPLERQTRLRGAGSLPLVGSPTDLQVILERNLKTVVAEVLARLSGFEAIRSGSH